MYSPCKILIVSDAWHPQINGVVRTYEHLCVHLREMGHDVHVIGPHIFTWAFPMPFYNEIRLALWPYRRLKRMIEKYNPDYIHIATEGPLGWAARRYCMENRLPFSTSYHTHFAAYVAKRFAWAGDRVMRFLHDYAERFIRTFHAPAQVMFVVTKGLEDVLRAKGFTVPMARLSRGVDLAVFSTGPATLFADLSRPIALYVGRVAVEKNLETFLSMPWEGSKVIVGEGPSRHSLARVYTHVHFVGKRTGTELAAYYRSADVFVFPSRTDTFGIVLIEALACGLPVAGYAVTGPMDIVDHPCLGVLHETDLGAAARAALAIEGEKDFRANYVMQRYNWTQVAQQFLGTLRGEEYGTHFIS